ncbi:G2/M phase-specific E3 ubiquitin-protein ligase-like [Xyrauchen texanus]|uniref:G2/M phase-specific E3 ubiquitin-protein ligase-like n=1 Tax=Xyrauchen texanus TaxID=154827 RepID=UPI00224206F3|nr:G2/M phase-specific E3 ubiquitin-protein ligase-like [Xyrauchen texanus]
MEEGPYVLLYPDGSEVKNIPGTNTPFKLHLYKEAIGKAYQRITLFISTFQDFLANDCSGDSSSEDSEVQVKSTSHSPHYESDTLIWDVPDEASTPNAGSTSNRPPDLSLPFLDQEAGKKGTNIQENRHGQQKCYTNYTRLYAPIIIESDSEVSDDSRQHVQEERTRRIFDGPANRRFLTFNSAAAREDEYFLAGQMIAVSIVHGGPGPRFLSDMLYNHLTGRTDINGTVEDITDETMKAALLEISSAASLDELHMLMDKYASLLQTAGCFDYPQSVEGKENIVKDFIQWYIIYRNQYSVQRFTPGTTSKCIQTLHVLQC